MKLPRSIPSLVMFVALGAGVLLIFLWIGLARQFHSWPLRRGAEYGLGDGSILVFTGPPTAWITDPNDAFLRWITWQSDSTGWIIELPLWIPAAASLLAAAAAGLIARRRHARLCHHCGYDRVGLTRGEFCPECGEYPLFKLPTV